jgi:hypothetical protein
VETRKQSDVCEHVVLLKKKNRVMFVDMHVCGVEKKTE